MLITVLTVGCQILANRDGSLEGIRDVFRENTMRIRNLRQYSDIWHLHLAANVLKSKIVMVFPNRSIRHDVRVDMNRVFLPSNSNNLKNEFCLFWTAVCDANVESYKLSATPMKFDHIVPMIRMEVNENFKKKPVDIKYIIKSTKYIFQV